MELAQGTGCKPSVTWCAGAATGMAKASPSAPISMGSPSGVPVPCTLTKATSRSARCAAATAVLMRTVCAGPFGAVSPDERPAWL